MDFVEPILSIISQIYSLAENVKANKDRCQRVAQRSKALQDLVLTIKQRGPGQMSGPVENALRELCASLEEAKALMMKFSQTKGVKTLWKSGSHEEKFNKVNERLTDNFQVLSGALQIEHGTMLSKVYQTVSGRSFDEEYYSGQSLTAPTSPTTAPAFMPQMPVSSPTSPTAPPAFMPPMQMSSPPTIMPLPGPLPPMQISNPTTPMPVPQIMAPRPPPFSAAATHFHGAVAPIRFPAAMAPRPALLSVPQVVYSSPLASRPALASVSQVIYSPAMTSGPVRLVAPVVQMTNQTTAVVRAPNGLYFS